MRDDLSGLRELLVVAEKRSFTAAAELRVTASAVSQSGVRWKSVPACACCNAPPGVWA